MAGKYDPEVPEANRSGHSDDSWARKGGRASGFVDAGSDSYASEAQDG